AIIDYLKGIASTIDFIRWLNQQGNQLCVCAVVECEVQTGLPTEHRGHVAQLLDAMEYLHTPRRAARRAGDWRGAYRSQGIQLSTTDCLIAAVAVEHGATLVTANVRHFPMPELTLQPLPRAQGGAMR
ncbi:MAG: type II toxin-antitoxin system VapC family toxin, partial [Dehalococcoidia bacterium]